MLRCVERTPVVITPKPASSAVAVAVAVAVSVADVARSPMLALWTPLIAAGDLKRTAPKPPARGSALGPVSEAVSRVLSGRETVAAAAWITGADPASVETLAWETTKSLVHQLDAECCTACLADGTEVHHRVRRSRGCWTSSPGWRRP